MRRRLTFSIALVLCLIGLGTGRADPPLSPRSEPAAAAIPRILPADENAASQPTSRREQVLTGITIDKQRRRVMLECTSLQPGIGLALVACSPHSREHEALMVVKARPQRIHLALLVCGYEPGHPVTFDPAAGKPIPATGDPLDIQVRWVDPKTGKDVTAPIEGWMTPIDPAKPIPHLTFLFTGSHMTEDGQYLADRDGEGSVVAIRNFPDAVMGMAGMHAWNVAEREFKGNDTIMPPTGTPCTLIILPPTSLRVELDRFGRVLINGRAVSADRVAEALAAHERSRDDARIELAVSPDAVAADVAKLTDLIVGAGFKDKADRRAPTTQPGAFVLPANDPMAAWDLLTAQWRQNRRTIEQNITAQRRWFDQLRNSRDLVARQFGELADHVKQARKQYAETIEQLRTIP